MNPKLIAGVSTSLVVFIGLSGCALREDPCEDVTLASEQIQQCQILQRKIVQAKGQPIIRSELERRYEQDCVNIRYYRDDKQAAICQNKEPMKQVEQSLKKKENN